MLLLLRLLLRLLVRARGRSRDAELVRILGAPVPVACSTGSGQTTLWTIGRCSLDEVRVVRHLAVWIVLVLRVGYVHGMGVHLGRLRLRMRLERNLGDVTGHGSVCISILLRLLLWLLLLAARTVVLHDPLLVVLALRDDRLIWVVERRRRADHRGRGLLAGNCEWGSKSKGAAERSGRRDREIG